MIHLPIVYKRFTNLKDKLFQYGVLAGTTAYRSIIDSNSDYLRSNFKRVTPENDMKLAYVQPENGVFKFEESDYVVKFAVDNNMRVHGHTFVWTSYNPSWIINMSSKSRDSAIKNHIKVVTEHFNYTNVIDAWDIVNEAIDENGDSRRDIWYDTYGEDYHEKIFEFVRSLNTSYKLFYNDFILTPAWQNKVINLAKSGLIDGVGLQMHLWSSSGYDINSTRTFIEKLANLNINVRITEADVRVPSTTLDGDIDSQCYWFNSLAKICKDYDNIDGFTFWGASDRVSWIQSKSGWGNPLPWDNDFKPKKCYFSMLETLK